MVAQYGTKEFESNHIEYFFGIKNKFSFLLFIQEQKTVFTLKRQFCNIHVSPVIT